MLVKVVSIEVRIRSQGRDVEQKELHLQRGK